MASIFWFILSISAYGVVPAGDTGIVSYTANPKTQSIEIHWKDSSGKILNTIENLIAWQKKQNRDVLFAVNGGMFTADFAPLGLFIHRGEVLKKIIRRKKAEGNFYIQPNGIFAISKAQKAVIISTDDYKPSVDFHFATQSGPLLLYKGKINSHFTKGSMNLEIRNGVCVLEDGRVLFAMSQKRISFYDFASYFKAQGCQNALYLDGSISQTYQPDKGLSQIFGPLGVLIAVTQPLK